jgi:hypothetical protein
MKWHKTGRVFHPDQLDRPWSQTHAQVPIVVPLGDRLRVYFSTRDADGHSHCAWYECEAGDPSTVTDICAMPALAPGKPGAFDDCGAMPSCIVRRGSTWMLFYTGWSRCVKVPYQLAIGCAFSKDGKTFERGSPGPILDRSWVDPYWVSEPFVMHDGEKYRMWYMSCTQWRDGESFYLIQYAETTDIRRWDPDGVIAFNFRDEREAGLCRPIIRRDGAGYEAWYSYRGVNFRNGEPDSYRIGYAQSRDGVYFNRKNDVVGIDVSPEGWDSEMVAYPWVYEHGGKLHMLYNGNGFGRSGIGHAWLER